MIVPALTVALTLAQQNERLRRELEAGAVREHELRAEVARLRASLRRKITEAAVIVVHPSGGTARRGW